MFSIKQITRAGAMVIALAGLAIPSIGYGAAVKPAQVGIISVTGDMVSGGSIQYAFNLSATAPGTLGVKATLKGKGLKKTSFPGLTLPVSTGVTPITGPLFQLPAGFVGTAVVQVKVSFNGKNLTSKSVQITVATPVPAGSLTVSTNLYDVGFENNVVLNGAIVPTAGMGAVTYSWTQTSGKPVTLNSNGVAQTSFTTDALTNFVNMGTGQYVNDIESGYTNLVYVTPEHRFGTVQGVALDNENAAAANYGFQVLVSDGSVTRTGLFTVACFSQTPAHPNIPVGVTAYFKGATNSTNWTLLSAPVGSAAPLTHTNGLIAAIHPDVEGVYIIRDNVTGQILTNTAASFVGYQFCAVCHGPGNNVNQPDIVTPWSQTGHATMAQRGVDGLLSSHYSESCFVCHTVGFNQSPAAINGNFFAVQQAVGWTFPSVLQTGNFAAMPTALQNVANIQCESCHGPGSRHPGSPSLTLDVRVCVQCHQNGTRYVIPEQWENSPHAGGFETLATSHGTSASCSRCHAPVGFISVAQGVSAGITNAAGATAVPTGTGPATCQVCHDPHNSFGNPARHQLRVYDTVQIANPLKATSPTVYVALGDSLTTANPALTNSSVTVTNAGASAACMACHNAREWPTQVQVSGSTSNKMFFMTTVPTMSTAGDVFAGLGGYDYGQNMGNSFHTHLADCQSCHMYVLRAPVNGVAQDTINIDGVATPVTQSVYNQFANMIGNHTFKMSNVYADTNGVPHTVDNIAACNQCHASFEPVNSFDFMPGNAQDYDGNGVVEGIQTETQGLMNNLGALMYATGLTNTIAYGSTSYFGGGYSTTNAALAVAQRAAAWNWSMENYEGSLGVHNTQFTIRLLQTSYTVLSTNYYGDATRTYQAAFPNAYLR